MTGNHSPKIKWGTCTPCGTIKLSQCFYFDLGDKHLDSTFKNLTVLGCLGMGRLEWTSQVKPLFRRVTAHPLVGPQCTPGEVSTPIGIYYKMQSKYKDNKFQIGNLERSVIFPSEVNQIRDQPHQLCLPPSWVGTTLTLMPLSETRFLEEDLAMGYTFFWKWYPACGWHLHGGKWRTWSPPKQAGRKTPVGFSETLTSVCMHQLYHLSLGPMTASHSQSLDEALHQIPTWQNPFAWWR